MNQASEQLKQPKYYSWDESVAGWNLENLTWIRDTHPDEMVESLWLGGKEV